MAGGAHRPALRAHRPAEGGGGSRRRRDERAVRAAALGTAVGLRRRRGDDRHLGALRHRLGERDRGAHAAQRAAGAGAPRGAAPLHDRVLRAGAQRARRGQERRGGGQRQLRAAGRTGPQQPAARRQRPGRRAGGGLAVAVRVRPACQRHPPRAAARAGRDPLPHRRRAAHRLSGAAGRDERDGGSHQVARAHGRGREAPAARRPHQDGAPGRRGAGRRRGRDAPVDAAHRLR